MPTMLSMCHFGKLGLAMLPGHRHKICAPTSIPMGVSHPQGEYAVLFQGSLMKYGQGLPHAEQRGSDH
jgi:hypothetical protein